MTAERFVIEPDELHDGRFQVYSRHHGDVVTTGLTAAGAVEEVVALERDYPAPRSSRALVRNPILSLPAAAKLRAMDPDCRAALADVLRELGADANARAEESWRKGKGPMAAYWKAAGVYARHIARALGKEV